MLYKNNFHAMQLHIQMGWEQMRLANLAISGIVALSEQTFYSLRSRRVSGALASTIRSRERRHTRGPESDILDT